MEIAAMGKQSPTKKDTQMSFTVKSITSHIRRVSVHAAILEVRTIHKHVHEIVVKLQHPELGVLVDKRAILHG
jgi:phosphate uptake regulator